MGIIASYIVWWAWIKLKWVNKVNSMVTLSEQNDYFMVTIHRFTISMKEYQVIRTIKTVEYENARKDFKCCVTEKNEKQYLDKSYS